MKLLTLPTVQPLKMGDVIKSNFIPHFTGFGITSRQSHQCCMGLKLNHASKNDPDPILDDFIAAPSHIVYTLITCFVPQNTSTCIHVKPDMHLNHDDVIKWKHFLRYWPFVRGIHRSPVNSPHKGQWRGALMFSLICVWINRWVNSREAGDLRRHRAHYEVTVMWHLFYYLCHKHAYGEGDSNSSCQDGLKYAAERWTIKDFEYRNTPGLANWI